MTPVGVPAGCGQCLPCRIDRRRIWTHRLLLESLLHSDSCFLTLTYNNENLPEGGSLDTSHPQLFIKRLRKYLEPKKIRYFLVGEYGDRTQRPHYHLIVFGLVSCLYGSSQIIDNNGCNCKNCQTIQKIWGKGIVYLAPVNNDTCAYTAGYVLKKMTNPNDSRLNGRYPEFSRMSNRPGIGAKAVEKIVPFFGTEQGQMYLMEHGDVPGVLNHGGKSQPLGKYLRNKLREAAGLGNGCPQSVLDELREEWSRLYKTLYANYDDFADYYSHNGEGSLLVSLYQKQIADIEDRYQRGRKDRLL